MDYFYDVYCPVYQYWNFYSVIIDIRICHANIMSIIQCDGLDDILVLTVGLDVDT